MNELQIIITGQAGSGKSTMAVMLEKFLKDKGFTVVMDMTMEMQDYETEEKFRQLYGMNLNEREVALMKKETKITLKQMQMKNALTKNENPEG